MIGQKWNDSWKQWKILQFLFSMTLRLPTWAHQDQEDREDSSASYPRFKSRVSLKTSGVYIYIIYHIYKYLSGWWFQPLWKILVSYYYSQYMEKCSKPPTNYSMSKNKNAYYTYYIPMDTNSMPKYTLR